MSDEEEREDRGGEGGEEEEGHPCLRDADEVHTEHGWVLGGIEDESNPKNVQRKSENDVDWVAEKAVLQGAGCVLNEKIADGCSNCYDDKCEEEHPERRAKDFTQEANSAVCKVEGNEKREQVIGNSELVLDASRPGEDGRKCLVEENAKSKSRNEDEKEAVYGRGKTRIVEEGHRQEEACDETCQ